MTKSTKGVAVRSRRGVIVAALAASAGAAAAQNTTWTANLTWSDQDGNTHGFDQLVFSAQEALAADRAGPPFFYGNETMTEGLATWSTNRDEADDMLDVNLSTNGHIAGVVRPFTLTGLGTPAASVFNIGFQFPSPNAAFSLAEGLNHNLDLGTFAGTAAASRALIASQTILRVHDFMDATVGVNAPEINLLYQFDGNQAFYNQPANGNPGQIVFAGDDYRDYDVVSHEYSHHLAATNGMDASPGGAHDWFVDNIRRRRDFSAGKGLGYSEGFATAVGIAALREANTLGGLNLPATAGDTWYNDDRWNANGTLNTSNLAVDMESHSVRIGTGAAVARVNRVRAGEGEEIAVARAIWDVMDDNADALQTGNDRLAYGFAGTWNRVFTPNAGAATAEEMWLNLATDLATAAGRTAAGVAGAKAFEAVAFGGAIFEDHGISADARTRGVVNLGNPSNTSLYAYEQNNDNSEYFRAAIFDLNWDFVAWTDPIRDANHSSPLGGDGPPRIDGLEFDLAGLGLAFGEYNWVVLSNPAGEFSILGEDLLNDFDASFARWYWSGAERFTLIPTPASAILLSLGGVAVLRRRRA